MEKTPVLPDEIRSMLNAYSIYQDHCRKWKSEVPWVEFGTVEKHELPFLKKLCQKASRYSGPIVEIGCLMGITTGKLALWKGPKQKVIAVDNFSWNPLGLSRKNHLALAKQILDYLIAKKEVVLLNAEKDNFYEEFKVQPAMVFLDALHTYEETKKDIEWAIEVGTHIISGHDYKEKYPGVIKAVNEFGGPAKLVGSVWELKQPRRRRV